MPARVRPRIADNPDDPRHGTANGYGNLGCRCLRCCAANTANHYAWEHADPARLRRKADLARAKRQRSTPAGDLPIEPPSTPDTERTPDHVPQP